MASTKREPLHVVVFPWLAFGHMIPFLELAEQLAKRGHFVTFLSPPRNLARLRPVRAELAPRIRFVPLTLPGVDGLPEGAESTADVAPETVELLKVAFDGLTAPFAAFLAEACEDVDGKKKPDWIVVDFAHHWLPPIADEHKARALPLYCSVPRFNGKQLLQVPCAQFLVLSAAFLAFTGPQSLNAAHPRTTAADYTVPPPWVPPAYPHVAFRCHEAEEIVPSLCRPNASGASDIERFWATAARCPLLLSRSSREIDGPVCDLLGDLFGKPFLPAGLLAPYDEARRAAAANNAGGDDEDQESAELVRWLDAQPDRSVLYVAFGSEAPLTAAHIHEIARGLDLAGVRFLWALRRATSTSPLPDGYQERVSGRGVIHVGWVPQVRVLAHAAVGAFMTHAGLSSVVESLLFGRPLLMLPFFADQGITAQLMAAGRVGVEVPRDERDGSVRGEDVAATVRRVMTDEEEGTVFVRNARALQEVLWDREKQDLYVDELVVHLYLLQMQYLISSNAIKEDNQRGESRSLP